MHMTTATIGMVSVLKLDKDTIKADAVTRRKTACSAENHLGVGEIATVVQIIKRVGPVS